MTIKQFINTLPFYLANNIYNLADLNEISLFEAIIRLDYLSRAEAEALFSGEEK